MKKILVLLFCFPVIGFGQDISYVDLIKIKDTKTFEKIMYEKGIRFIKNYNYYTCAEIILTDSSTRQVDFKYGYEEEIDSCSEFYRKSKTKISEFGRNYNSEFKRAEVFYEMKEYSKFQNFENMLDPSKDNTGYQDNYIVFSIHFADKSEYKKFWDSINVPLEYLETNKDKRRIYRYKNVFVGVLDYDNNSVEIKIKKHLFSPTWKKLNY